jgi:hypothetical protein
MTLLNFHNGKLFLFKNSVSFNDKKEIVTNPIDTSIDMISSQVGGLLVGDSNVTRGGKVGRYQVRKPIRFII